MMVKSKNRYRVALVTESLWSMAGANRVLDSFAKIFPDADIFALFGEKKSLSDNLNSHRIFFSRLNGIPFIKKVYRYTFNLWPFFVEKFDFSQYDLVVSSSSSVTHGIISPLNCLHVAYIHSPMRYAWDLRSRYSRVVGFSRLKQAFVDFCLVGMRVWDVVASSRPDHIIANSNISKERIEKYWDRKVDAVIHPPVEKYKGKIYLKRNDYYISGAPFEPNKEGEFLLSCAAELGFKLKVLGNGSLRKRLEKKYSQFKNIEFLGWITDEEKWKIMAKAKGYIVPGIEEYGIFPCEAISAGTPVIAFRGGGSLEIVKEGKNGMFFDNWNISDFRECMKNFEGKKWNYKKISEDTRYINDFDSFKKSILKQLVDNK